MTDIIRVTGWLAPYIPGEYSCMYIRHANGKVTRSTTAFSATWLMLQKFSKTAIQPGDWPTDQRKHLDYFYEDLQHYGGQLTT